MKKRILFFLFLPILFLNCKEEKHLHKIGFSQAMSNDEWREIMNNSIYDAALLNKNIDLKYLDANNSIEKQIDQIEQFIKDSIDLLIVSPIKQDALTPIVEKAINNNIPVIVVDRKTSYENYTSYIGTDNFKVGKLAAKIILSDINNLNFDPLRTNHRKDNKKAIKVNVLEIKGLIGSSPANERSIGFNTLINNNKFNKKINLLDPINGDWNAESIKKPFRKIINSGKKIDYVFVHNDRMAYAAWQIAKEFNSEEEIKFIGVDGLNTKYGGIELVKRGVLEASILYPNGGEEAILLAEKILNHEPFNKNNFLKTIVINSFNVDLIKSQIKKIADQKIKIKNQHLILSQQNKTFDRQKSLIIAIIFLFLIALFYVLNNYYLINKIKKKNKALQLYNYEIKLKNEKIKKVSEELKINLKSQFDFFMNISHEFKTPLSLILNLIESLKENSLGYGNNTISLLSKNSYKLFRLVTQLLDFRKIRNKRNDVKVSKTNIYKFTEKIIEDFKNEIDRKEIKLFLEGSSTKSFAYVNHDLIDKVFYNLIDNALKFSTSKGSISIKFNNVISDITQNEELEVSIKDEGIGIPKSETKNIFKVFFKGSNNKNISSGIGLYLSKEFLKLNQGRISYRKNIKGSEFIVNLQSEKSMFNEKNVVEIQDKMIRNTFNDIGHKSYEVFKSFKNPDNVLNHDKLKILIIEDDIDMAMFLKLKLNSYQVFITHESDSFIKAFDIIPDIIICDVNLPGKKNGFEICEILKEDLRTSHIPIIILTAESNNKSMIKGLKKGADLYLTKPFRLSVLTQSLESLINNRKKLQYYYTNNIYNINKKSFKNPEQAFFLKLNDVIDNNLGDPDFSVENLSRIIGMSRVQLYRKVKSLLDINISDYIINYKLKRAKYLLKTSTHNISEIAYNLGFNSPNYFSTVFKTKYGHTPLNYRKNIKKLFKNIEV